jgi:molybdopterin molybdotransferase
LPEVLGKVVAEDVTSGEDVPPFASSAMDGYAVRAFDLQRASTEQPTRLRVLQDVAAGQTASEEIEAGTAIRIMTGAPVPAGADCVVRVEDTQSAGGFVEVLRVVRAGVNIRKAAEDVTAGQVVVRAGTQVRAAELGVMASVGCGKVRIFPAARVAIVTTGDELVDVNEAAGPGRIRDANSYTLMAQTQMAGGEPRLFARIRDTMPAVREAFEAAVQGADLVITNGGVSVGDYDYVRLALEQMGAQLRFWGVEQKPGRPLAYWAFRGKPIVSLPGYPVSAMVCFEHYVRPALRKMMGHAWVHRPIRRAELQGGYDKKGDRRLHFVRVRAWEEHGTWKAALTGPQGSGLLMSMSQANGLALIGEEVDQIADGEVVAVNMIDLPEDH